MNCFSQNETSKWYFGENAGLDFMTSPPTILTNGAMGANGCSSISDGAGNLLFYTNGNTVWNKSHFVMANGTGLLGFNNFQNVLIVKQPGNSNIYFVFTTGYVGAPLYYSTIDMSLASGMGSVTVKNTLLQTSSCNKLTAVRHCNGSDVWLITHDYNSFSFQSNLITAAGVNTLAVNSIGVNINNNQLNPGDMKISPNGKKLGVALLASTNFYLYDFNRSSGVISNQLILGPIGGPAWGCEFSPDGTKFYGSRNGSYFGQSYDRVFQWDLCAGSDSAIIASQYDIGNIASYNLGMGGLQLAQNGKIYIASVGNPTPQTNLCVINSPNIVGAGCNFNNTGQSIAPKISGWSLPNFVTTYLRTPPAPFTYTTNCSSVSFTRPGLGIMPGCNASDYPLTSTTWYFGDPGSGNANTSSIANPTHQYSSVGTYSVLMILQYACGQDSVKQTINVTSLSPLINVAGNFTVCEGQAATLTASGANSYTWSNNSFGSSIDFYPLFTTTISVIGMNAGNCSASQIVTLFVSPCTEIQSLKTENVSLKVYPALSNSRLTIITGIATKVQMYNQTGILILEEYFQKGAHMIDISKLNNGIYFLRSTDTLYPSTIKVVKTD